MRPSLSISHNMTAGTIIHAPSAHVKYDLNKANSTVMHAQGKSEITNSDNISTICLLNNNIREIIHR